MHFNVGILKTSYFDENGMKILNLDHRIYENDVQCVLLTYIALFLCVSPQKRFMSLIYRGRHILCFLFYEVSISSASADRPL